MNIRFDGKTVAVTGAGHGFGRCIAQTFARLGARVFATDILADELVETAADGGITVKVVDLRNRAAGAAWSAHIRNDSAKAARFQSSDALCRGVGGVARIAMALQRHADELQYRALIFNQQKRQACEPCGAGGRPAAVGCRRVGIRIERSEFHRDGIHF